MLDFAALPPEINSARMYSGAGSAPMLAAGSAWSQLAAEMRSAADSYSSVVSNLTSSGWQGPASMSMADAAAPYAAWMNSTAAQAEQTAAQAQAAVTAYESAFSMTVPPTVVTANRVQLATLVATNILGQNTPAIAATEANYARDVGPRRCGDVRLRRLLGDGFAADPVQPAGPDHQCDRPGRASRRNGASLRHLDRHRRQQLHQRLDGHRAVVDALGSHIILGLFVVIVIDDGANGFGHWLGRFRAGNLFELQFLFDDGGQRRNRGWAVQPAVHPAVAGGFQLPSRCEGRRSGTWAVEPVQSRCAGICWGSGCGWSRVGLVGFVGRNGRGDPRWGIVSAAQLVCGRPYQPDCLGARRHSAGAFGAGGRRPRRCCLADVKRDWAPASCGPEIRNASPTSDGTSARRRITDQGEVVMIDYAVLPPEINSARMYSGAGSTPMLSASTAWSQLASEMRSAAASYSSVIANLTGGSWQGPASTSMADAAAPYAAGMNTTAAQAEQTAAQAQAAAAAYESAFSMTVPPQVIAANRICWPRWWPITSWVRTLLRSRRLKPNTGKCGPRTPRRCMATPVPRRRPRS